MKKLSIRLKITLWFGAVLVLITAAMSAAILYISSSVLSDTIRDELVLTVESNADEVAFRTHETLHDAEHAESGYRYLEYNGGYLEIDDDFLNSRNSVYCAVYSEDGSLVYGENPIAYATADMKYTDGYISSVPYDGVKYFVYDKLLRAFIWSKAMAQGNSFCGIRKLSDFQYHQTDASALTDIGCDSGCWGIFHSRRRAASR